MELPINTMVLNNCTMAIYKNRFPVAVEKYNLNLLGGSRWTGSF